MSEARKNQKYECRICWTVYDPAEGDMAWQVPPGTAFADLPAGWCCPNCEAPREKFLLLDTERDNA